MNVWKTLEQWASMKRESLTAIMVGATDEFAAYLGQAAIFEQPGSPPQGPLTKAPFWAEDWAAMLEKTVAELPPRGVGLPEREGRRYYVARLAYPRCALVLGGGHVGEALAELLFFLGFKVSLWDDRPEFSVNPGKGVQTVCAPFDDLAVRFPEPDFDAAAIVTRSHVYDTKCLRRILSWKVQPPYLGMIGSLHRVTSTLEMLAGEGYAADLLARVHTPAGLNIGSQTPREIAVSIAAEIIQSLSRETA
ncbi:MAG: XdhC family protein [Candidatus Adiutrix sp.]|jgi:xanthine dehydrogenase accessory factor|nr:XdhC family protein [Candidatus Adiutrix sp.]